MEPMGYLYLYLHVYNCTEYMDGLICICICVYDIPFSLGSKGANFFEFPNQMIEGMELEMPKPDVSIKIEAFKMFQCG